MQLKSGKVISTVRASPLSSASFTSAPIVSAPNIPTPVVSAPNATPPISPRTAFIQALHNKLAGTPDSSRAHCMKTYCVVKFLGSGDNGDTYAAISKFEANEIFQKHGGEDSAMRPELFDELRTKLVAIKFYSKSNLEGDLVKETTFLTKTLFASNLRITSALDFHLDGETQWLALPFCSGGSLERFEDDHASSINNSFIWHVGLQMCEAVCFILFGITDFQNIVPAIDHPNVYHGDIWSGNTLLRPASDSSSSFGNFPELVTADFGRATELDKHADQAARNKHTIRQLQDIQSVGTTMSFLRRSMRLAQKTTEISCNSATYLSRIRNAELAAADAALTDWIKQFRALVGWNSQLSHALPFLEAFLETAKAQRATQYQPLSPEAIADMAVTKVTSHELAVCLTQLWD